MVMRRRPHDGPLVVAVGVVVRVLAFRTRPLPALHHDLRPPLLPWRLPPRPPQPLQFPANQFTAPLSNSQRPVQVLGLNVLALLAPRFPGLLFFVASRTGAQPPSLLLGLFAVALRLFLPLLRGQLQRQALGRWLVQRPVRRLWHPVLVFALLHAPVPARPSQPVAGWLHPHVPLVRRFWVVWLLVALVVDVQEIPPLEAVTRADPVEAVHTVLLLLAVLAMVRVPTLVPHPVPGHPPDGVGDVPAVRRLPATPFRVRPLAVVRRRDGKPPVPVVCVPPLPLHSRHSFGPLFGAVFVPPVQGAVFSLAQRVPLTAVLLLLLCRRALERAFVPLLTARVPVWVPYPPLLHRTAQEPLRL